MGESKSTRSGILPHAAAGLFFFAGVQIILSIVVISTAVILLSSFEIFQNLIIHQLLSDALIQIVLGLLHQDWVKGGGVC